MQPILTHHIVNSCHPTQDGSPGAHTIYSPNGTPGLHAVPAMGKDRNHLESLDCAATMSQQVHRSGVCEGISGETKVDDLGPSTTNYGRNTEELPGRQGALEQAGRRAAEETAEAIAAGVALLEGNTPGGTVDNLQPTSGQWLPLPQPIVIDSGAAVTVV